MIKYNEQETRKLVKDFLENSEPMDLYKQNFLNYSGNIDNGPAYTEVISSELCSNYDKIIYKWIKIPIRCSKSFKLPHYVTGSEEVHINGRFESA